MSFSADFLRLPGLPLTTRARTRPVLRYLNLSQLHPMSSSSFSQTATSSSQSGTSSRTSSGALSTPTSPTIEGTTYRNISASTIAQLTCPLSPHPSQIRPNHFVDLQTLERGEATTPLATMKVCPLLRSSDGMAADDLASEQRTRTRPMPQ